MSASWTTRKMSDRHESYVADLLGGRQTRGSGNQWRDTADGKHPDGTVAYSFAWDGKSTHAQSASVSLDTWDKLVDQADDHMPLLPIRFYADKRLTMVRLDLAVVRLEDFAEILQEANEMAAIREQGCLEGDHDISDGGPLCTVCGSDSR